MKLVIQAWLLLLLVSGAVGAAGDVGAACGTGDTCTDANAACDSATSRCTCKPNFVQKETACVPVVGQPCGHGQCVDGAACTGGTCTACTATQYLQDGVCVKKIGEACTAASECGSRPGVTCGSRGGANKCTCDTSNNFGEGSDGVSGCSCAAGYELRADNTCGKKIKTCTVDGDCMKGAKCGTDKLCECDTAENYALSGTTCGCASNYAMRADGTCGKVIGQTCISADECIDNAKCATDGGSSTVCLCDDTKNVAAGTTGGTSCSCAANYAAKSDGSCGKVIGQTCSAASDCIDNAKCDGTSVCVCDETKNVAGTTGGTSCSCAPNYAAKSDGSCGKVIGQGCGTAADCIDGTTCADDGSGSSVCLCDDANNFATGTSSATSCSCKTDYAPGTAGCAINVAGTSCSSATDCGNNALCTGGFCVCDTTNGFKMNTAGSCVCDAASNYAAKSDGSCGKVVGQACSVPSDCVDGAVCTNSLCACDAATNFTASGTSCTLSCPANYSPRRDGTCGKVVGQACGSTSECIDGAVCDPATDLCACDAANGYAVSGTGCACGTGFTSRTDGRCGKAAGQSCSDACSSLATCNATYGFCSCDAGATLHTSTYTCHSGASGLFASGLLVMAVLVTSRLT